MGLLKRAWPISCALGISAGAIAGDWELALDLRGVSSSSRESFLENGQGKLRFDSDHEGLELGRFRAAWSQPIGELLSAHVEASSWDDDDKNPIDLTEAYLEFRPYPRGGFRTRLRAGAFYPPLSLENRALGWQTPYTITPSAIGSWLGEEIRAVGLEGQLDWLGTRLGHSLDIQVTGALFGWNDPAGTQLAAHGFAMSDRQTTLFGRVGAAQPDAAFAKKELFHEIDGRPGYYLGAQLRYFDRAFLDVLHYDNRADPTRRDMSIRDFAWQTTFDAAAMRVETGAGWTVLLQALEGETVIDPGIWLRWAFDSQSAMLARRIGSQMVAARYDRFGIEFNHDATRPGSENGHAWTVAYSYDPDEHWHYALEWLRVSSDVVNRAARLGETPFATEQKIEIQVRYSLSGRY